jgi:hypothetical protein
VLRWIGFSETVANVCRRPNFVARAPVQSVNFDGKAALLRQRIEESPRRPFHLHSPQRASSFPEKFRGPIDFPGQAFVHRTIERRLLQHFAVRRIWRKWNMNL